MAPFQNHDLRCVSAVFCDHSDIFLPSNGKILQNTNPKLTRNQIPVPWAHAGQKKILSFS